MDVLEALAIFGAGMAAGSITDDTEQAVLLARLLVKGRGTIDPRELAAALTEWERAMAERGSLDLLGPSTKRAVAAILAGVPPEEAGATGTTTHGRMGVRVAPPPPPLPLPPQRDLSAFHILRRSANGSSAGRRGGHSG